VSKSRVAIAAGAVLIVAALVSPLFSSSFTQGSSKTVQDKPTPTKTYPKAEGIWTYNCELPVQQPEEIMLTCADGGMIITDIRWQTWNTVEAIGIGTYSQNMCEPNCADGKRAEVPVKLRLSELFEYKGRKVLQNLDIKATSGRELPNGTAGFTWDVAEFVVRMNWDVND
jgi:hypothetical protein